MDNGNVTALTLLDLSDAFDTIDHLILSQSLHVHFGISGPALGWFKSYFSDRYQSINISGTLSFPQHLLPFGVPQGSVLGPVLFSFYTTSLSQVITNHNLRQHLYEDDTQVYISISQSNALESVSAPVFMELILSSPPLHIVQQPPYLASLLHLSNIPRQLRSSISQLIVPKTKLNLGKRAFSVAAPRVWNELPITLKTSETIAIFRKKFKTYLLQIAFPP